MPTKKTTAPKRRVAITKKVSLAEFSDGWDDCFVLIVPATFREVNAYLEDGEKRKGNTPSQDMEVQTSIIRTHFICGKIMALDESDKPELVDMTPEDSEVSIAISNKLFNEVMGFNLDPKGSQKTA